MAEYTDNTEDYLLDRLRLGDDAAFTEIYNRYWEKLLAIGYYYTHNEQAAEDIVHDVMIGLWTRRSELAIHSLQAYLATAVKFAVFKAITRDRRRRPIICQRVYRIHRGHQNLWRPPTCRISPGSN